MNLHDFLQSHYALNNRKMRANQKLNEYDQATHAELQATQNLINGSRLALTYLAYVKLLAKFLLTKLRVIKTPPTIEELLLEDAKQVNEDSNE